MSEHIYPNPKPKIQNPKLKTQTFLNLDPKPEKYLYPNQFFWIIRLNYTQVKKLSQIKVFYSRYYLRILVSTFYFFCLK